VSKRCRVAEEEVGRLWATGTWVCDLALSASLSRSPLTSRLEAIPRRLVQVAKEGHVLRYWWWHRTTTTSTSKPSAKGFVDARSYEELDTLEWAATPTADALARLVSLDAMLQGHEE
jgi:hypothetical protein